jgi:hypothetical protein
VPHIDRHKVLPTTVLEARDKSGRKDKGYLCPVPASPNRTSFFLSFYHLLYLVVHMLVLPHR